VSEGQADNDFEIDRLAAPTAPGLPAVAQKPNSSLRILVVTALALAGCRILSNWHAQGAGIAAVLILASLAARFVWRRPRLARGMFYLTLPVVVGANALAVALPATMGLVLVVLGFPNHETADSVDTLATVICLIVAGSINLCALACPSRERRRWRLASVSLATLVGLAGYQLLRHALTSGAENGPKIIEMAVGLCVLALVSFLAIATDRPCDAIRAAAVNPRPPSRWHPVRLAFVLSAAAIVFSAVWAGFAPVWRNFRLLAGLELIGIAVETAPGQVPASAIDRMLFDIYGPVCDPTSARADAIVTGDVGVVQRLFQETPALQSLHIGRFPAGGESMLQPFAGRSTLRYLHLGGGDVSDATLAEAAKITSLQLVEFPNARISDQGLAQLAPLGLTYINLQGTPVTGDGLAGFQWLPWLGSLNLAGTQIGDEQLSHLARFTGLTWLSLPGTRVTDAGLKHLAGIASLRVLDLTGTQVSGDGLKELGAATSIMSLTLADTQVNDAGLAQLRAWRAINGLDLSRTQVTDAGMRELAGVDGLVWLNLGGNHITDEGVIELANIQSLASLGLAETLVSDAGISALTKLAFLQGLDLSGTRVTDAGLKNLGVMKWLANLALARTAITDRGIEQIRELPMLHSIDVRATNATRAGIENLQKQAPNAAIQWDGDAGVSSIE
jgi:hypothetical protein